MDNKKSALPYKNLTEYRFKHVFPSSPFYEKTSFKVGREYRVDLPESWSTTEDDTWRYCFPDRYELPLQGWKIHISVRPGMEDFVLDNISNFLLEKGVPFKFRATTTAFYQSNMKYADRSGSGKFITVYPRDDEQFCYLLDSLNELTENVEGPYILSDTKYGNGSVYFRYGGFYYRKQVLEGGKNVMVIATPDGNTIEDKRVPFFVLPDFVKVPQKIEAEVFERLNPDADSLARELAPYSILDSLHFSNGGGVYLGRNEATGKSVVLKEARPFAGYTGEEDAIARLRREKEALIQLQGIGGIPEHLGYKVIDGHEFLIEEFVEGVSLQTWLASNYPFSLEMALVEKFEKRALRIARAIIRLVNEVHSRGIAIMDINMKNFIVGPDESVSVIDFEGARHVEGDDSGVLGTPGFIPYERCGNADRDAFALTNLLFYIFWPSWSTAFSPRALETSLVHVESLFSEETMNLLSDARANVPSSLLRDRFDYSPYVATDINCGELINRLAAGIRMSSQMLIESGDERRYPGDASQFLHDDSGSLDIETGAAGIMLMMSRAGMNVQEDVEWIKRKLDAGTSIGFHGLLRGVSGIASALSQSGYTREALALVPSELPAINRHDLSIRTGLSGTILALCQLEEDTEEPRLSRLIESAAEHLKTAIQSHECLVSPGSETGNAVGLFDGWSGAAIACKRLMEYFHGSSDWLALMQDCLKFEMDLLSFGENGYFVNYDGVNFGYLSEGTAGVFFALTYCTPNSWTDELEKMSLNIEEPISLNGGLFCGICGKAAALLCSPNPKDEAPLRLMIRNVANGFLFARDEDESIFMVGNGGACLSADYSTGSAGLIGFLLSFQSRRCEWFPVPLH